MTYIKIPLSDPDITYKKGDICYKWDDGSIWKIENECTKNGYVTVRGFHVDENGWKSVYRNYKPSQLYKYATPSVETEDLYDGPLHMKTPKKVYLNSLGAEFAKGSVVFFDHDNSSWVIENPCTANGFVVARSTQDENKFCTYSRSNLYYLTFEHEDDTVCEVKSDKVQHPPHYTKWVIQPRDFCMKNDLPFWMGSVLKYIMRAGEKQYDGLTALESEILDLEKAREFIEHRIRMIKNG